MIGLGHHFFLRFLIEDISTKAGKVRCKREHLYFLCFLRAGDGVGVGREELSYGKSTSTSDR